MNEPTRHTLVLDDIRAALDLLREARTFRYALSHLADPAQIFVIQDPLITDGVRVHIIATSRAAEILAAVAALGYDPVRYP